MNKKGTTVLGTFLVVLSLMLAAGPARADEATDLCIANAEVLRLATVGAESLGVKDEATLESKALDAQVKLAEGKPVDALTKLQEYSTKLDSLILAAKPKITSDDSQTLSPLVADAIACVTPLAGL